MKLKKLFLPVGLILAIAGASMAAGSRNMA